MFYFWGVVNVIVNGGIVVFIFLLNNDDIYINVLVLILSGKVLIIDYIILGDIFISGDIVLGLVEVVINCYICFEIGMFVLIWVEVVVMRDNEVEL